MKQLPVELRTERLVLHKHRSEEVAEQFKHIEKDRRRLEQFIPWVSRVRSLEDLRRRTDSTLIDWENRSLFDFTMKTHAGEFLGHVGLYRCDWSVPKVEIGYWVVEGAEGKGYVREAIEALEQECFRLGVERIEIRCDPVNVRSAMVASRLGYRLEGTLYRNVRINDKLQDTQVWAKLRPQKVQQDHRPPFIGHWKDFFVAEEWSYPNSTEFIGRGSPVGRKLGLVKIGIHIEMLEPGRRTSWPHAERDEEEFVYVIEGTPDVWIDGTLYRLMPGDFVAFPAGTGIAHTFINNTDFVCQLLAGGEASRKGSKIYYPLHPARNHEIKSQDRLWEDAPERKLGPHDGLPDRGRK